MPLRTGWLSHQAQGEVGLMRATACLGLAVAAEPGVEVGVKAPRPPLELLRRQHLLRQTLQQCTPNLDAALSSMRAGL